eukprot:2714843-Prymnesium_polylepis.2
MRRGSQNDPVPRGIQKEVEEDKCPGLGGWLQVSIAQFHGVTGVCSISATRARIRLRILTR